jgi:predicted negative regulator of RcsB-dependent stress response
MSGLIAGEELETVEQSVSRGDISGATQRLAVLLRLDPALAPIILSAADRTVSVAPLDSRDLPALHLVRGDAYRALGRDNEAAAAYQAAHQALGTGPSSKEPT